MLKLKNLRLINFGGYSDNTFDFEHFDPLSGDLVKPLALFYGPNGIGKSTILEAIKIVSNPYVFKDRQQTPEVYLRSMIRDDNYDPIADAILAKEKRPMRVEATFLSPLGDLRVVLNNSGFEVNELPQHHGGYAFYADADHPINWSKFQLIEDQAGMFIELAESVFGFKCDLDGETYSTVTNPLTGEQITKKYYQDFIIEKGGEANPLDKLTESLGVGSGSYRGGKTSDEIAASILGQYVKDKQEKQPKCKVHFSKMSAGEKKLATFLRMLCNPDNISTRNIILADNIEMHVYYKRHAKMLDKLRSFFPDKQIIATTHSNVMIEHVIPEFRFDLEIYRPEYKMIDDTKEEVKKISAEAHLNVPQVTEEWAKVDMSGIVKHETEDGMVVFGPASLANNVVVRDDNGVVIPGPKKAIDRIIEKSIKIDYTDAGIEGAISDPVVHEFHASTPQAALDARDAKIAAEAERKRRDSKLWRRIFNAGRAAITAFKR